MHSLIENYINGNLSDAKRQAKRYGTLTLLGGLADYGYGPTAAMAIAAFLKGKGTFQAACDAEEAEQNARKR
jgi:hypothetical protein